MHMYMCTHMCPRTHVSEKKPLAVTPKHSKLFLLFPFSSLCFCLTSGQVPNKRKIRFIKRLSPCLLPVQVLFLSSQRHPRLAVFFSCQSQHSFTHTDWGNWGTEKSPRHPSSSQQSSVGDLNYVFLACLYFAVAFFFVGERQVF